MQNAGLPGLCCVGFVKSQKSCENIETCLQMKMPKNSMFPANEFSARTPPLVSHFLVGHLLLQPVIP